MASPPIELQRALRKVGSAKLMTRLIEMQKAQKGKRTRLTLRHYRFNYCLEEG